MNIVLSGGGMNGIAFLSLIKILEERNILHKINKFAGSSVGSIFIYLISIKFNFKEIYNIFMYHINKLYIINYDIRKKYIMDIHLFEKLLRLILYKKFKIKTVTFLEYYNLTKKELNIVCTNLNNCEEKVFNIKNTPNVDIIKCILASCAIPIIFNNVQIDNEYYIDGGFTNLFPINIFKNDLNNTIAVGFAPYKHINPNIIQLICIISRGILESQLKNIQEDKYINFIKLRPLLNTFNFFISITEKKRAYNSYYNILNKKICIFKKLII